MSVSPRQMAILRSCFGAAVDGPALLCPMPMVAEGKAVGTPSKKSQIVQVLFEEHGKNILTDGVHDGST